MAFNPDKCLKFRALADNCTIAIPASKADSSSYQFSKDGVTWQPDSITLNSGETCYVKGTNYPTIGISGSQKSKFSATADFEIIGGSIMSLIDDGAGEQMEITQNYAFYNLFSGVSRLKGSLPSGLLPATTLAENCYSVMFGDSGITSIPSDLLPAMTMVYSCYSSMFIRCQGLTSVPAGLFPATTLAEYCYGGMFDECDGITTLPENLLPAKTLAKRCYASMFIRCHNLATLPNTLFKPKTLAERCFESMFRHSSIAVVPEKFLPDVALETQCYLYTFGDCSKIKEVHAPFKSWHSDATNSWLLYASSTGDFYCYESLPEERGDSRIPTGWTIHRVEPPEQPEIGCTVSFLNKLKLGGHIR